MPAYTIDASDAALHTDHDDVGLPMRDLAATCTVAIPNVRSTSIPVVRTPPPAPAQRRLPLPRPARANYGSAPAADWRR